MSPTVEVKEMKIRKVHIQLYDSHIHTKVDIGQEGNQLVKIMPQYPSFKRNYLTTTKGSFK